MSTDSRIIETAKLLSADYGMPVTVGYKAGDVGRFHISGGDPMSSANGTPAAFCSVGDPRLETAEALFREERNQLAKLDPHARLKREAAAAGMMLVPVSTPLDLKASTAAQG